MRIKHCVAATALGLLSGFAQASLSGDTITTTYGGYLINSFSSSPGPVTNTFGSGPYSVSFTDPFAQNWIETTNFTNGNKLDISFLDPTYQSANILGPLDLFTVKFSFASTPIKTVSLESFSTSTTTQLGDKAFSRLGNVTRTGANSFTVWFSYLITGDSYRLNIVPGLGGPDIFPSPVPEAETYMLLLSGIGLIGFLARRRKQARSLE